MAGYLPGGYCFAVPPIGPSTGPWTWRQRCVCGTTSKEKVMPAEPPSFTATSAVVQPVGTRSASVTDPVGCTYPSRSDAELRPVGTKLSRCPATVCRARPLRRDRDEVGDRRFDGVPGPANTRLVCRPLHPDRLRRRAGSCSLPRILVDQPVRARPADHLTTGNCRAPRRSQRSWREFGAVTTQLQ